MKSVMLSPIRTHKDDSRIGKNPNESGLFIRISAKEGLGRKETTVSEFLSNRWASTVALNRLDRSFFAVPSLMFSSSGCHVALSAMNRS